MFRSFLLVLALGTASATTIATVNCNGNITSDPTFAQCSGAQGSSATASVSSFLVVDVNTIGGSSAFASASASLSGTYLFTVTGGTGGGFFLPCLGAAINPPFSSSSASFGGYSVTGIFPAANICTSEGLASATPFTYGVGQQFAIGMSASAHAPGAGQWDAAAGLGSPALSVCCPQFEFWDSNGAALSNVSFTLTAVPEPGSFASCLVAFLVLLIVRPRRLASS